MANGYFERGEVYWIRMDSAFGFEQGVGRPGVVISCDSQNNASPTVTIAFCSKQQHGSWEVEIEATGCTSYVKCSQINTVDKSRIGKCIGVLNSTEMKEVERILEDFFELGYVDDVALKAKDAEIADRNVLISDLKTEMAGVKAEVGKKDEEIASLKMEIEMWQKCYGRCMDMLVETKVAGDVARRTAVVEPKVGTAARLIPDLTPDPPKQPEPPEEPEVKDDRLDINSCTATALKKIGFSLPMARKIVENRPFKSMEDLKRVNGLKASLYKLMVPKLCCNPVVKSALVEKDPGYEAEQPTVPEKVNINTATGRELMDKLGINECYAYSITSHRNKNGLYSSLEELKGVKGISFVFYDRYKDLLTVGEPIEPTPSVPEQPESEVKKVNVNTASAKEIYKATGLCETTCYSVTGYRKKHGPFEKLEDLLNVANFGKRTLQRYGHLLEV